MSDPTSSERDVLALLDRAAAHTPPLHLDRQDVVDRGQQIRRRRRAGGAGTAVGVLALAGAVWLGSGLAAGALRGAEQIAPAGVGWEVDEPTTLTLVDGVTRGGDVSPLTVTHDGRSASATFGVAGTTETVVGRPMEGGALLFVGERATVAVWQAPEGQPAVMPMPVPDGFGIGPAQGDDDVWYLTTTDAGYVPEDLVFNDEDSMWTAGGAVADTAELRHGRVRLTAVSLPDLGIAGYLDRGAFYEVDTLTVSTVDRPWWRGGGFDVVGVARLPEEAVFARVVLRDDPGGEIVQTSPGRQTVGVGDCDLVFLPGGWLGDADSDRVADVQWSHDGLTWHQQDPEDPVAGTGTGPGPVGAGGSVVLLGETYEVATDSYGWPQLLDADGSVFLTVSDADGPPAGDGGGVVMWRDHWWPWSDRTEIHFAVDGQPALGPDVEGQDAVSISGPAGVVGLVAVPPGP